MNKNKTLYFRKTHKLLIQMISLRGEYHFNYTSLAFANSEDIVSTTSIQPNKIIEVTTIDIIQHGKESLDSEVLTRLLRSPSISICSTVRSSISSEGFPSI
jgi:hypothetical protein